MNDLALDDNWTAGSPGDQAHQADGGVEYSAAFQELDARINAFDTEGQGPLRKGERPFQWDAVASAAEGLLDQAPDLRVALWLLRALHAQGGLCGLAQGLARIAGLLALEPDSIYPRATDGETAREVHAISLAWLGSAALLHQVRTAALAPGLVLSSSSLRQDSAPALALEPATRAALAEAAHSAVQQLDSIVGALQQEGVELSFNVTPLREELAFLALLLRAPDSAAEAPQASSPPQTDALAPLPTAGLRTRADVQQALAAVIAYFRENEPGHPAPLLLQRVQRMLGASFEELMGELYVDAEHLIARIEKPQAL